MLNRRTRYQGAIIKDHHILLIKLRVFPTGKIVWTFPGGGIEPNETEEECVRREMKEETNLEVRVISTLLDEPPENGEPQTYLRSRTYLCECIGGEAKPGYDPEYSPEIEAAGLHGIIETHWFDLRSEADWDTDLVNDPIIYKPLQQIRKKLGYLR